MEKFPILVFHCMSPPQNPEVQSKKKKDEKRRRKLNLEVYSIKSSKLNGNFERYGREFRDAGTKCRHYQDVERIRRSFFFFPFLFFFSFLLRPSLKMNKNDRRLPFFDVEIDIKF